MSHSAPFRQRPNLHLALTQSTGSPRHPSQSTPSRVPLPTTPPSSTRSGHGTPFGITSYSPFPSARSSALPTSYSSNLDLSPRRSARNKHASSQYRWVHKQRLFRSQHILPLLMVFALLLWWFKGGKKELDGVKVGASHLGREFLLERRMHDYQFFPATNPKIHYMGRWTATPNRLRKDGAFPGVYFDITVKNTTSFFVALHNAPPDTTQTSATLSARSPSPTIVENPGHLSFHPLPSNQKPASPVSLLVRVDEDEYVLLPDSSSLVPICVDNLSRDREHSIRVVAPMTDDGGKGIVELEGLWLSKGGSLDKVPGSTLNDEHTDEDDLHAENDLVGEKHRASLSELEQDGTNRFSDSHHRKESEQDLLDATSERRKVVEIITDSPGSFTRRHPGQRAGGPDGLLAGVMGWEYLLGEMFGADHVCIGVDGMCLTQDCFGSTGFPAGIGDVFFRSGPHGSEYFEHSWVFTGYIPDVLVLNIGESDLFSFDEHQEKYNKTLWDLTENFENTYVSLIKGIRRLGYSKHPAIVESERLNYPGIIPHGVPVSIPIFVMRPPRGQLEQATQNVVTKLRSDGDRSVFWLDTSGWLDVGSEEDEAGDFFMDEDATPPKMRLTEQGNQRVAIFLHTHVCRYLANAGDKCAFLPQEVYQGTSYDEHEAAFDEYLEKEKEKNLKKLFWGGVEAKDGKGEGAG